MLVLKGGIIGEEVLFECFNFIASELLDFSKTVDLDGNITESSETNQFFRNFFPSIRKALSIKKDIEEVLGNCLPEILGCIASSGELGCRYYAAYSPACPKEAIKKLMFDESNWVRIAAMKHPHAKDFTPFV